MTAEQYNAALRVSTLAALKAQLPVYEIVGMLELAKGNVLRLALSAPGAGNIARVEIPQPPGEQE